MRTISFVIPVYNEEKRLVKTFYALSTFKLPKGLRLEKVIFVNDGSTDRTTALIRRFVALQPKTKRAKYQLISYKHNRGKGYAVTTGMRKSTADYTLIFDADMSTPLSQINKFVPYFNRNTDVVVSTRKNGKSTVLEHQPFYREWLGKGFTKTTQLSLGMNITDFTCGFKAFSKRAARTIFADCVIHRWGYDAEILFLAKKHNFIIAEKAVTWSNDRETKVKLYKAIPDTITDLLIIRLQHSLMPFLAEKLAFGPLLVKTTLKSVH